MRPPRWDADHLCWDTLQQESDGSAAALSAAAWRRIDFSAHEFGISKINNVPACLSGASASNYMPLEKLICQDEVIKTLQINLLNLGGG